MKAKTRQSGLSLMEEVVVVATIALLIVFGVPAVRSLMNSIEAKGGGKPMISAALSTARALAANRQSYAGIRFQNRYQPDGRGCQYMIFILHEEPSKMGGLTIGFRAADGFKPIKLPDSLGVMDLKKNGNFDLSDTVSASDFNDTTTFSILFSPSGKLVIHNVQTRNRNGKTNNSSKDEVFNTKSNVENGIGMFIQDDYPIEGFDNEPSRNSFIIYDRDIYEKTDKGHKYSDYLEDLASHKIYINPYTGAMIE